MARSYLRATLVWTAGLTAVWVMAAVASSMGRSLFTLADALETVAYALAFCSFAGGLALAHHREPGWLGERADRLWIAVFAVLAVGALVWVLLAYAAPVLEYRSAPEASRATVYPLGAHTPGGLTALRDAVSANPDPNPRPSMNVPFRWAASWVDYLRARPRIAGALAILNVILGVLAASMTLGMRPGRRRRVRWFLGLLSAFVFAAMDQRVTSQLASHPEGSGLVRSWSVLVPFVVVVVLGAVSIRSRRRDR